MSALIALDWGTSSLRAQLLDAQGEAIETRSEPWGIMHTPDGDFAQAFRTLVGDWRERWPHLPALACGMIGSRNGWREVPYIDAPATLAQIGAGLLRFDTGCGDLHLVPGVMQRGALPNVLRGEETQVFGALQMCPELIERGLLVLPGTHSKWVDVRAGRLDAFATYMTGELFAVLRDHSILGRPARDEGAGSSAQAFQLGLGNARDAGAEGIAARLFTARSLYLAEDLPAAHTLDYLSGLLIGEEVRSVVASLGDESCPPLVLIGEQTLCDRYRQGLEFFGISEVRHLEHATRTGLWRIAQAAGLVYPAVI